MTRPEALIKSLCDGAQGQLAERRKAIWASPVGLPPIPAMARAAYKAMRAASARAAALERQLRAGGFSTYNGLSWPPKKTETIRTTRSAPIDKALAMVKSLRSTAQLAVLGLPADKARPILLKLERDLKGLVS